MCQKKQRELNDSCAGLRDGCAHVCVKLRMWRTFDLLLVSGLLLISPITDTIVSLRKCKYIII